MQNWGAGRGGGGWKGGGLSVGDRFCRMKQRQKDRVGCIECQREVSIRARLPENFTLRYVGVLNILLIHPSP